MVAEDGKLFLENLTKDASLRAQLMSTGAANVNSVADFALSKGFVFTENDLKSAIADFPSDPFIDQLREQLKLPKAAHTS